MIINDESREYAMQLLAAMVVEKRAEKENRPKEDVWSEFRKSTTFASLFDAGTGLWLNGPDYISDEYDLELNRTGHQT